MALKIKNIPLFSDLNSKQIDKLKQIAHIRSYSSGEVLFFEGETSDAFYIIMSGEIQIKKLTETGKEKILEIMGSGEFFGEMGIIENKARSATANITSDSKLLVLEKNDFLNYIETNMEVALKMIAELSKRLRVADLDIKNLAFMNVETRLKKLLIRMAKKYNESLKKPVIPKRTHQELASFIGTSRETVTRIINKMMQNDLIEIKDNKIFLKKINNW